MMIRTGIISVPEIDDAAIDQLRLLLREQLPSAVVVEETASQNQLNWLVELLRRWADEEELALILTVGGTYPAPGPSAAEIVPEATAEVVERLLPGFSEAMRAYAQEQTELALLDRGIAGIRSRSIIINLPAGAASAHLFLEGIIALIPAALAYLHDDPSPPQIEDDLEIASAQEAQLDGSTRDENDSRFEAGIIRDVDPSNQKAEPKPRKKKGLDPAEFADFLQRKK